ncbi:hypothetical protein ACFZB9_13415 [Kitasatospora sp. NPDC008050]|uniref:hypothetical protein n=1 Tax=Kitasatospora sp. NPDC008050 TaxID=3364021 RepID=UPI0036EEA891
MTDEQPHAPRPWRWTTRLVLAGALLGPLSAAGARWADRRYVTAVLAACLNSPGLPLLGRAATWAAPVLGLLSTAAAVLLLTVARRAGRRVTGLLDPLLTLLLFLAPLLLLVELVCWFKVQPDFAPRAHHCMG